MIDYLDDKSSNEEIIDTIDIDRSLKNGPVIKVKGRKIIKKDGTFLKKKISLLVVKFITNLILKINVN